MHFPVATKPAGSHTHHTKYVGGVQPYDTREMQNSQNNCQKHSEICYLKTCMCMFVDTLRISMFEKVHTIGKPQQFDVFQIEAQQVLQFSVLCHSASSQ